MTDSLYNVILDGKVIDGFDKQETQDRLAKLFKIQPNVAARMLNGVALKVKEAVDLSTADKYREALEKAGAKCRIEEISLEIDLDAQLVAPTEGAQADIQSKPVEEPGAFNQPGVAQEKVEELNSPPPANEPISSVIEPASMKKQLLKQKKYIVGILLLLAALSIGYFIYIQNSNGLLPVEEYKEAIIGNWSCGKKSIDKFNGVVTISDSLGWSEFIRVKDEDLIMWFSNKTDEFVGNVMQQSNTVSGTLGVVGDSEEIFKAFASKGGELPILIAMPGDASSKITILAMSANAMTYTQDEVLNYCNRISATELANYLFKSKQPPTNGRLTVELAEAELPGSASAKPDENVLPQAAVTLPDTGITIKLTDTGITDSQCYAAGIHTLVSCNSEEAQALSDTQDGMIGRDADPATNDSADGKLGFSYTKLGDNGQPLAIQNATWSEDGSEAAGSKWSCVKDNVTGLIWEVKTDDGGLRDKDNTYKNYDDPTHAEIDAASNSRGFVAAVNRQGLCGARDWRLPKVEELHSLVDYGVGEDNASRIDANVFPNTSFRGYWSSSPYAGGASYAWGVNFNLGHVYGYYVRINYYAVRLVRASQ